MLAVAGGKGGCGKTTTALGLALAAARRGEPSLVVDADVEMPDLHLVAGVDREPHLGSGLPEAVAQPVPGWPEARVLPAPPLGTDVNLERALDRCRFADGPFVLVDCPAGAGPDAARPLRVADLTLVVTTPTPASLENAAKTAAMSRAVGTPVAGAVLARTDRVPDGVSDLPDGLEDLLGAPVLGTTPPVANPLSSVQIADTYTPIRRELAKFVPSGGLPARSVHCGNRRGQSD